MKNIYYALLLLLCIGCNNIDKPREGDIIFQTVNNERTALLEHLSESPINHCGIVIMRDSSLYVLHVDQTVTLTPLHTFMRHGEKGEYTLMRATNNPVKIDYKKYMLANYDRQLRMGNNRYYNAELVYDIFKNDLGIELCQPRPVCEYHIDGIVEILQRCQIRPDQAIVTPADIYKSEKLKVYKTQEQANKEKKIKMKQNR